MHFCMLLMQPGGTVSIQNTMTCETNLLLCCLCCGWHFWLQESDDGWSEL